MNARSLKQEFIPRYTAAGSSRFYRFLLFYATNKLYLHSQAPLKTSPEEELLQYYNQFLVLYRREGDINYLQIASIFRKAAHKIYRVMLKNNLTSYNCKFLNLV